MTQINNNIDKMAHVKPSAEEADQATGIAEEKFKLLVDSVRDYGIFFLDTKGCIQSWNTGAERIKGYSADEVIGKHFSLFYTPSDIQRQHPQFELEQAIKNGKYEEEGWRLRKNGSTFWANVIITPLYDKNHKHLGYAKVTRDLTERKEAEEMLKRSEERSRKMFEGVKDYAMILLNPDGTIASWNEGARRIKGYEPNEIIGKYFAIFYPEQDVKMGKCEYELKEAAETGRFEDEGWRVRKDGTRFWASVVITAIRGSNRELLGYSKVTRDMTERKRADDLLKMAYSSLEKRIEERTEELTHTNKQLQEAIKVRDEFLSIASHELRTPLTPLKLQIQSLSYSIRQKKLMQMSEERLERMAATCDRSISRLASLVDNLLDVSRINMGKLTLNYETFDLVEMAKSVLEAHRNEIQIAGNEVTLNEHGPVYGSFDRLRIEQVFLNLLTNALKYGGKKPIEISISLEEGKVCMKFRDQGVGIPKKDQQRIFERFERLEGTETVGGLGLGLFITRQIVEAHGGKISVESADNEGSTFKVSLPVQRPASH